MHCRVTSFNSALPAYLQSYSRAAYAPIDGLFSNQTWYERCLISAPLLLAALLLSACGGALDNASPNAQLSAQAAPLASGTTIFQLDVPPPTSSTPSLLLDPALVAQPSFHLAPALLDVPSNEDAANNTYSAHLKPHQQTVAPALRQTASRHLTVQDMEDIWQGNGRTSSYRTRSGAAQAAQAPQTPPAPQTQDTGITPLAGSGVVATYTPAQIRSAYGMAALPSSFTGLSAAQAAQLGAGQTIYIVDAMHDPNLQSELTAFNQKFGLPACTLKTIATNAALPLAAASATSCELSVVYTTASGAMTTTAPAYDAGWATEITLDVQWAHATAPLARIILIEAPDASLNSLLAAIQLANKMGPGIVSMSFGANEGNWTASVDSAFTGTDMSYLAATGDNGAAVSWPSVSSKVLAVGGTTLTYSGSGSRSEISWSGTGGGTSAYTSLPSYQNNTVPGFSSNFAGTTRRIVADVAFNADPSTGQYVAVIAAGSSSVSWVSAGGTSLSTPQWAGILAVANATRKLNSKTALGAPHSLLYGTLASVPGTYASTFADIAKGSNGSCATCTAKTGYDLLSGLGTPNISALLSGLAGASIAPSAPVVSPASISGKTFVALSFTVSASSVNPLTYSLSGAPAGMVISSTGVVSWPSPVAGSYSVTVTAKDSKTGLSGQGIYSITIVAQPAPVVNAATISGKVGTPLSFNTSVTASNPLTYSLTGAPSGMSINSSGVVSWSAPLLGSYAVTVNVKDNVTSLTGKAVYTVNISAQSAPVVSAATLNAQVGKAFSYQVSVNAANPVTYSLSGAPSGLLINSSGLLSWAAPVQGSYAVTVIAKDSKTGLSGQAKININVTASGPVITASSLTGVAGKTLTGSINISDPGVSWIQVSISGAPLGMSFSMSGTTINLNWASPVTGSYTLKVTVLDSANRSATLNVPISISAK